MAPIPLESFSVFPRVPSWVALTATGRCRNPRVGEFSLGLLGLYQTPLVYLTSVTMQGDGDGVTDCVFCAVGSTARADLYAEGARPPRSPCAGFGHGF